MPQTEGFDTVIRTEGGVRPNYRADASFPWMSRHYHRGIPGARPGPTPENDVLQGPHQEELEDSRPTRFLRVLQPRSGPVPTSRMDPRRCAWGLLRASRGPRKRERSDER